MNENAVRKMVSMPADLATRIDDYRFDNRIKSEAEAIRILIELGLSAATDDAVKKTGEP